MRHVSVEVRQSIVPPRDADGLTEAWRLKECIRDEEGLFKQSRDFFSHVYETYRVYRYRAPADDSLVGFAIIDGQGYILFLAVDSEHRGEGYGRQLIEWMANTYGLVSCHVRTTNHNAIQFYERIGFRKQKRVKDYYSDDGNAYYLVRPDDA